MSTHSLGLVWFSSAIAMVGPIRGVIFSCDKLVKLCSISKPCMIHLPLIKKYIIANVYTVSCYNFRLQNVSQNALLTRK